MRFRPKLFNCYCTDEGYFAEVDPNGFPYCRWSTRTIARLDPPEIYENEDYFQLTTVAHVLGLNQPTGFMQLRVVGRIILCIDGFRRIISTFVWLSHPHTFSHDTLVSVH